jgi:hypothetical protein
MWIGARASPRPFHGGILRRRWRAQRAVAARREVAAPGRPRPLLVCGVLRLRRARRLLGGWPPRCAAFGVGWWCHSTAGLGSPLDLLSLAGLWRVRVRSNRIWPAVLRTAVPRWGSRGHLPLCPSHQPAAGCRWGWRRPWLCSGGHGSDVLPHVGCRRGWVLSHLVQLSVTAGTMSRSCSWKLHGSAVGGHGSGSCGGGGSLLVAWLKHLSELDGHGWLCGERRRPLVCLGAVKPFVYVGGTRVPWRRLAAHSLRPPPRCRWCRGVGWSRLCASVRLR